jgi:hypothetical protein
MIRANGRRGRREVAYLDLAYNDPPDSEQTYRSLQMQMIGRRSGLAGVLPDVQLTSEADLDGVTHSSSVLEHLESISTDSAQSSTCQLLSLP